MKRRILEVAVNRLATGEPRNPHAATPANQRPRNGPLLRIGETRQRNGAPACHNLISSFDSEVLRLRVTTFRVTTFEATLLRFFQMPSANLDRRPSADTRVGILPTKAPGLSRRDGAKVVEMFGGRGNLPEVERPATSAATDFRLNHKPRKKTKEDNELRKLFAEASAHALQFHRAPIPATVPAPATALRFVTPR